MAKAQGTKSVVKKAQASVPEVTTQSTGIAALAVAGETFFGELTKADLRDIRDNMGGDTLSPFDLDRIKIPAGGSTVWELPSIDGTEAAKDFSGVVIEQQIQRVYWPDRGENKDPDPPSPRRARRTWAATRGSGNRAACARIASSTSGAATQRAAAGKLARKSASCSSRGTAPFSPT